MSAEMVETIIEFIRDEYVEDEDMVIDESTQLISSGLVDSFSMVSLKMFLEEEYSISIPDEEASTEAFDTVSSIVKIVTARKG